MKKRVLSMLMALALCLTLLPAPAWAAEDAPEGSAIVQEEQQEEQEKVPAVESPAILEQAAENGIAVQDGGDSAVENAVAEVAIDGKTTQYTDIVAAFATAQGAESTTVKTHVSHILDKLDVKRRAEARTAAKKLRLILDDL